MRKREFADTKLTLPYLQHIFLFLSRRDPSSPSSFAVEISSSFVIVFIEPFRRRHRTFPSSSSSNLSVVVFIEPCRPRLHRALPPSSSSSSAVVIFIEL
ncbi:hypothetical protein F2Q68_00001408 [Brassica cretica]|uniref:Uncharacterized protein n=1 Tax=Brassica cretica TaxID=69181 RepID=A0A8S9JHF8_BRACR|nr:hypothetical protein F2Q68_00001408 [Brassica cretica]